MAQATDLPNFGSAVGASTLAQARSLTRTSTARYSYPEVSFLSIGGAYHNPAHHIIKHMHHVGIELGFDVGVDLGNGAQ